MFTAAGLGEHAGSKQASSALFQPFVQQTVIWNDLLSDMSEDTKQTSVDQPRVMKNTLHTEQEQCCMSK